MPRILPSTLSIFLTSLALPVLPLLFLASDCHAQTPAVSLAATSAPTPTAASAPTPTAASAATAATALSKPAAACKDDSGWDDPATPRKIFGNTWYVGTCGITSVLITSPQGHVLIDSGTETGGKLVEANILALGFALKDVRHILISHTHHDHVGGLAYLQSVTGAKVYALPPADAVLRSGKNTRDDPQFLELRVMQPVANVHALKDGQVLQAGLLKLTVHATPGHTPGGSSWTWRSCEGSVCQRFAYIDSLSAIADKVFHYGDDAAHPGYLGNFKQALKKVPELPCDVLLTPHPGASGFWDRFGPSASEPLVDSLGCQKLAERAMKGLEARLVKER